MVICDKMDPLHTHLVSVGVVVKSSLSLPLLVVTALVFSNCFIRTVF